MGAEERTPLFCIDLAAAHLTPQRRHLHEPIGSTPVMVTFQSQTPYGSVSAAG